MTEKIDLNVLIDLSEAVSKDIKSDIPISLHHNKTKPSEFKILKKLAKGGYGEVYVVEKDKKIYAMKKVSKQLVLRNTNTSFFKNEKDIMTSHGIEWLVKSYMCLQDDTYLYYIMELVHGGDLMGYLSKKDIMKEEEIKFYGAEIASAINSMHEAGWIHRDLKPDNILLDRKGHVKLADFGSCAKLHNGKATSNITVGTPDYISPDVLSSAGEYVIYGKEVDFWTIGVILYEMVYGGPPFYSESLKMTYSKINNIDYEFEEGISEELKDLITKLLCKSETRMTFQELKEHIFFKGINWEDLRNTEPPFKPTVASDEDISNFVDTEFSPDNSSTKMGYLPFVGFTYDPDHVKLLVNSIIESNNLQTTTTSSAEFPTSDDLKSAKNAISKMQVGSLEENAKIPNAVSKENTKVSLENIEHQTLKNITALDNDLSTKQHELISLKSELSELNRSKEELASQVSSLNSNFLQSLEQISHKKDNLDQLQYEINSSKETLQLLKTDISEKMRFVGEVNKNNSSLSHEIQEDLNDLKKAIERCKFNEKLDQIQQTAYWFYKQNTNLKDELTALSSNDNENKSLEDLKKQLRLQKSEIREYEQKIENEMVYRKKIEDEIKALKKALKEANKSLKGFSVDCTNANSNRSLQLVTDGGSLTVNEKDYLLNSVYIRDLKNNEMHHLSHKKRGLCLYIFFLAQPLITSSASGSRRSLKALEADLEKEQLIYKSINQLIDVLEGKTKIDAINQKNGAFKKIEQLKCEIENSKKSTITECTIQDDEKVYEFNSHIFYEKTVAKGSLCEYCNQVLYGVVNQAYCCRDCLLVVHKSCYVLVDISCELNSAIKAGTSTPIICKCMEDKNKLLKLNKVV